MHKMSNLLGNAVAVAACYAYLCFRGGAARPPHRPRTVLVAQTAKLGDMVCSTPVFHALKASLPQVRVVVAGSSSNQALLDDNVDVDAYLPTEASFTALVRAIRALRPDVACLLNPDSRMIAAAFLGGVPTIIVPEVVNGYCPWQTKTYRLLRRLVKSVPHRMEHYAPREYLRTLEPLGIHTEDTTKHLGYSEKARTNVETFLNVHALLGKRFSIISPSAGNKIKNWPGERFARVAEHIVARGFPVVIIGTGRDKEEVAGMIRAVTYPEQIVDASLQFPIDELKALIARAVLFVSVDTGPLYIAEAFCVPTVDIVGPVDEREQPPRSHIHRVVVPPRTAAAVHIMNARMYDKEEALRQTNAITVEMVIREIDDLLHN